MWILCFFLVEWLSLLTYEFCVRLLLSETRGLSWKQEDGEWFAERKELLLTGCFGTQCALCLFSHCYSWWWPLNVCLAFLCYTMIRIHTLNTRSVRRNPVKSHVWWENKISQSKMSVFPETLLSSCKRRRISFGKRWNPRVDCMLHV